MSESWDRYIVLKTGFGNVFDVGHGWTYDGLVLVADAIWRDSRSAWAAVEEHAKIKPAAEFPS